MVLEFKFKYLSPNNTFISILDNLLKKKFFDYKINRVKDFIFLYIEGEEDSLIKISDELSQELPMSIFLKDFTLEVITEIPRIDFNYTSKDTYKKSYCSHCLSVIEDRDSTSFYNPFYNCDVCGTTCDVSNVELISNNEKEDAKNYKELFENLAFMINENKRVKIKTLRGEFVFKKFDNSINNNKQILCTNINNISNLIVSSKLKVASLLSIEKPIINFYLNAIYKSTHELEVDTVDIVYSYDLILHLLSKELQEYNISFLEYEKSDDFDCEFKFDSITYEELSFPKLLINEDRFFLLENKDYEPKLDEVFMKFNEKSKSQFMVLINENDLYEKSILNLYLSTKYDDGISLYSPKIDGMIDVLNFKLPKNLGDIFKEIEKESSGEKLIANYKEKFPITFINAINYKVLDNVQGSSISTLFNIASIILGIDDIYESASKALMQKGPRIDYKLNESKKIFNREFNLTKFIKSGISFKLAGVDDKTLSLGYVESFIYFLSDLIDEVNEQFSLDGISLCGDLVSDKLFNKTINGIFNKNLKLYYNIDFPIQK